MAMISGIYRIKNIINKNCYIGSAKNITRRWDRHRCGLRNNKHENIKLQRAWNKYGEKNFVFEIIEECDINDLLILEQKYLNLKPKYNIGKIASGGDNLSNNPKKNEIIAKMKKTLHATIKNMNDVERKDKYSRPMENNPNWKDGKTYNYCNCGKRISNNAIYCKSCRPFSGENNSFFNKHHTIETKNELSKQRKGKYSGTQNIRFSINNIEYFSLGDAYKKLGISISTILWRLRSKNKKFENYKYIK